MKKGLLILLAALPLALAGCGGGDGDGMPTVASTGTVTIVTLARIRPAMPPTPGARADGSGILPLTPIVPVGVDRMQVSFLDAGGEILGDGPVEIQAEGEVTLQDVPLLAASTRVDYLRNGGYALNTGTAPVMWSGTEGHAEAVPEAARASTTRWTSRVEGGAAHIAVAVNDSHGSVAPTDFLIRGVAYSPAPIGFSNKDGPSFGDIFWDSPGGFLDFERVWKRDIENLRDSGFNTVRTYSMIAHVINNDGSIPAPADFTTPGSLLVRQHLKFLDALWNNGHNPIYVIVGIPMPDTMYVKALRENPASAAVVQFWNDNFSATLQQLKEHPAVLGFTIFNEIGGQPDYVGDSARATFYWRQVQNYAELAKEIAPDKLVGWAFNDDPVFASETVQYRQAHAQKIDFYGVNAFQAEQLQSTLGPWAVSVQGSAARPVILTEFGLPATGHRDQSTIAPYVEPGLSQARQAIAAREGVASGDVVPPEGLVGRADIVRNTAANALSIYADDATVGSVAAAVSKLIPEAFSHPIMAGMTYFEWSDEWWKQDPYVEFFIPSQGNRPVYLVPLSSARQEGGTQNPGFPNGFWDEEGFGLNAIALDGREADQVYSDNPNGKGGNVQVDRLIPRTALMDAVIQAYENAKRTHSRGIGR